MKYLSLLCIFCLHFLVVTSQKKDQSRKVKIVKNNDAFELLVDNRGYFIKGAVGSNYLEKLKRKGGNSIRTGSNVKVLDQAHALGLTALVGLPVKAERDGMNYDDTAAVRLQHQQVMDIVRSRRNHPAIIMWALGNELDFIQANVKERYNVKVWNAVNALAEEIHQVDPNHPVMTVVGSIDEGKIKDLIAQCPAIDLLGINEYGDLLEVPNWLRQYGWNKPYAVTEWGPTGFWQVPRTERGVPVEETSSMKAAKYKERYELAIAGDKKRCLGSYVFLWRQHQERTHTWFGMFDENGLESEAVEVMQYEWTGKWPSNRVPRVDSLKMNSSTAYDNVLLKPATPYKAQVWISEPEGDNLVYKWEILLEGSDFPYGGNGEKKPAAVPGLIKTGDKRNIEFNSPGKEGSYRLFVYAYDGKGHFATANIPFYVQP